MLDDVALKKYLNETPYPAQWATAKTLEDVAALEPARLFQLDGAGSGDADVSSRYAEVVEELGRHATSPSMSPLLLLRADHPGNHVLVLVHALVRKGRDLRSQLNALASGRLAALQGDDAVIGHLHSHEHR